MLVLDSTIAKVRRNRDFDRIEARVSLVVKTRAGQPLRRLSVLTNVAAHGVGELRQRLLSDAIRIAKWKARRDLSQADHPVAA